MYAGGFRELLWTLWEEVEWTSRFFFGLFLGLCLCLSFFLAAFNYEFGALDNADNVLSKVYQDIMCV